MLFKDVYGQDRIKQRLIKAVEDNRVPHAMLFYGASGTGKLALAIAFAQYVCCENKQNGDSCGECPSCKKFKKLIHPDLHFAYPITRKSDSTTCISLIKEWRNMVIENPYFTLEQWLNKISEDNKQGIIYTNESDEMISTLSKKPFEADTKIMIIWLAEKFHEDGANKILKLLEEPPGSTIFILIVENMEQMLSTIISRTQGILIPPINDEAVAKFVEDKFAFSHDEAINLAHTACGSIVRVNEIIESDNDSKKYFDLFVSIMRMAYKRDVKGMRIWTDEIHNLGRKRQISLLQYMQRLIRENFIMNLKTPSLNYITKIENDFSSKFSAFVTEKNIIKLYTELALAEKQIEQNCQAKLVFFDLAMKFAFFIKNR